MGVTVCIANAEQIRDNWQKSGQLIVSEEVSIFPEQCIENKDCPGKFGTDGQYCDLNVKIHTVLRMK